MQSDSDHEDLMNPTDELKKKIVTLAGTMREWNEKTKEARESVRKQLKNILDLGLNQRKMEKTELRNLINEIFEYHGISESWLRKLLPKGLKETSKTPLSYLQKQEIEEERQRLLLKQQVSKPQQQEYEAKTEQESLPDGSTTITSSYESHDSKSSLLPYETETNQLLDPKTSVIRPPSEETNNTIQDKRIEGLEAEVRRLSEEFVVKAPFHAFDNDALLAIRIDPIKKVIIEFWTEKATSI